MTAINMRFGETVVPAELNESATAKAFADRLPATITVSGTGIDFCGHMPFELPYEQAQVGRKFKRISSERPKLFCFQCELAGIPNPKRSSHPRI